MGYLFIFRGCINSLACLAFSTANFVHPCWETRDKQWGRLSGGLSAVQPGAHVQGADCTNLCINLAELLLSGFMSAYPAPHFPFLV